MNEDLTIRDEFKREDISEDQIKLMNNIRAKCTHILDYLEDKVGTETCYSQICKIKLEEFAMFANKSICKFCKPNNSN